MILLDTSVLSALVTTRHTCYEATRQWIARYSERVAISEVTVAEIAFGLASRGHSPEDSAHTIERITQDVVTFCVNRGVAKTYARIRAQLWLKYGTRTARGTFKEKRP